ncbi:MAG: peptidoglycan DD-metalloendopeptidase family protein [Actinomycetota bacterium]|nr:peptidoglycan DD-metalloendopeptidase family protein [Actinomycetota bacterium]
MMLALPAWAQAAVDTQTKQINSQIDQKKAQIKSVKDQLQTLQTDLDGVVRDYQGAYLKLQEVDSAIASKQRELNSANEQQIFYQNILNKLSVFAYRDGDVYFLEVVLGTRSFKDLLVRVDYLATLSHRQASILKAAKSLRGVVQEKRDSLAAEKTRQREVVAGIQGKQDDISRLLAEQQVALNSLGTEISTLRSAKKKQEAEKKLQAAQARLSENQPLNMAMIFPLPQPYAHSFINDWGFPRAGNPAGHQGNDIFAAKGTPVVAVDDGVIGSEFGFLRIGGWRFHVLADSGVDYYFAHLNNDTPGTDDGLGGATTAYAPGIGPGVRVKQGQLIGWVGDSGDAESTPPHLHFGVVVNSNWVNPFPYLSASDRR